MSDGRQSRRSKVVNLTLLGLVGVVIAAPHIPEGKTVRRNVYGNREHCERDYSPSQCEPNGGGGSGGSGGRHYSYWRGPEYYEDRRLPEASRDPGPGRVGLSNSVETSTRGGFGRVGRALRAVG